MDELSQLDKAFEKLIGKGEQLLAKGRPQSSFESLQEIPPQVVVDFLKVAKAGQDTAKMRINPGPMQVLFDELKRFAPGRLAFSALEPGQGTSFVSLNVARLWAAEHSSSVLFLELYTGEASVEGLPEETGAQYLTDNPQQLENCMYCLSSEDSLYYLPLRASGRCAFWSSELLGRIESSFDVVVIDCAPLVQNPLFDGVAHWSDGVALVCAREPDGNDVSRAAKEIDACGGHFLGVALNEPQRDGQSN